MIKTKEEGSRTAKRGFQNEKDVIEKFNDWKNDEDAQEWLEIMDYDLDEVEDVEAVNITGGYKTDVQVKVLVYLEDAVNAENLSIKLVSNKSGFNQIDKRWIDDYVELWDISKDVEDLLKFYTAEYNPEDYKKDIEDPRDERRVYLDEMTKEDRNKVMNFFKENKIRIVADIIKGRGKFSADWMLVAQKVGGTTRWILEDINTAMNIFGGGEVYLTGRGNPRIGNIGVQRKGGDNGRETANMLQFKCDPTDLFDG